MGLPASTIATRWQKGVSGNPKGRSKNIQDIEAMLDDSYRTVDEMRIAFAALKRLAVDGEIVNVYDKDGNLCGENVHHNPAFMKLYLERILGAIPKPKDDETVEALARSLLDSMIATARARQP